MLGLVSGLENIVILSSFFCLFLIILIPENNRKNIKVSHCLQNDVCAGGGFCDARNDIVCNIISSKATSSCEHGRYELLPDDMFSLNCDAPVLAYLTACSAACCWACYAMAVNVNKGDVIFLTCSELMFTFVITYSIAYYVIAVLDGAIGGGDGGVDSKTGSTNCNKQNEGCDKRLVGLLENVMWGDDMRNGNFEMGGLALGGFTPGSRSGMVPTLFDGEVPNLFGEAVGPNLGGVEVCELGQEHKGSLAL